MHVAIKTMNTVTTDAKLVESQTNGTFAQSRTHQEHVICKESLSCKLGAGGPEGTEPGGVLSLDGAGFLVALRSQWTRGDGRELC